MKLYLRDEFKQAWSDNPFAAVKGVKGEVFREVKGRTTLKFELNNKTYFLKRHEGVGWPEIIKNLIAFRRPILGARDEYDAIQRLEQLGVETLTVAAYGERGCNPATRESFLVTDDLVGTVSLEDFCADWQQHPPPTHLKHLLIKKVAGISATLHNNGLNHRDYYICHFHLDVTRLNQQAGLALDDIVLHVIDLHRMQMRDKTPPRWAIKDIGGLYFSAMDLGLKKRDIFRFMKAYTGQPLKQAIKDHREFWAGVEQRGIQMYTGWHQKPPELPIKINR